MRSPALCLFLLGIASAIGQTALSLEGRAITRVDFDPPDQPLTAAELSRRLPFKPGDSLSGFNIRLALQALYQTGRYQDIEVDAEPDGAGVRLKIVTEFTYFLSGVSVEGVDEPPNASQLITAGKLALGTPVTEADVVQAERNLLERLRANGLYRATVTHRLDRSSATEEAAVTFHLEAGPRARFDGVKLSGDLIRPADAIVRSTGWQRGFLFVRFPGWREVTENRVQSGIQNILQDLQKRDRLQGRVALDGLDYHEDTNRVTPSLRITSGPITEVKTTGAKISSGRLRQLVPVFQERSIDRNLLVEGRRNLLEHFQADGYFDVQVDFSQTEPQRGRSLIEYKIDRGIRHKLVRIEIAGNRYFDQATLRERMYMLPASFPRSRFGRFSERYLEQDQNTLRDLYRANGFRDASVSSEVTQDVGGKHGNIGVALAITEGPQWFVRNLELAGVSDEDRDYLLGQLQSTPGQPFSEANVAADRDAVLTYYYNNGFPNAVFDWTQNDIGTPGEAAEPRRVDLRFEVMPGEREYVRDVLVRGLNKTNATLVGNRILLAPGDPISQRRIAESQQRLYDLGIFSKVQTAIQDPDGEEDRKYVLFRLDEARKYSVNLGIGAEVARIGGGTTSLDYPAGRAGFSPRASVGVSRINFLGLGHTVGIQTLASTLRQRALANYIAPQFKGHDNLALTFSLLFDRARDVRTFSAQRLEGSAQLSQRLSRANTVQYRYTYRRVTQSQLNIDPALIPLLSQPNLTGLLGLSFIQDRRDDPVNSRRGMFNTMDLAVSDGVFGSKVSFVRLLLRNSTYTRLGRDLVLARSVQFGYNQRYGGDEQLPLAERYYAGGGSSHRAFPENQAGPRDLTTGFPLGGSALLFHSTELRFPLIGDNLGGVLFHDMGNVYTDVKALSFRVRQRDLQDFDYMVHAVGFGIRYRTPVGPIRIDLSLSPNSPRFNGYSGSREDLLKGIKQEVTQRLNVFQFHFSLGQTF